jgi:hypothetical protein
MKTKIAALNKSRFGSNFRPFLAAVGIGAGLFFGATNLLPGQSLVQNGGFETGDLSCWNLINDSLGTVEFRGFTTGIEPYSGDYSMAFAAAGSLGYLSQTISTVSNQDYLISFWFNNPLDVFDASGGLATTNVPNEFSVAWNGTVLFDQVDVPPTGWTNMQFVVTATNSSMVLRFGERVDPWYLGLDDVSVTPYSFSISSVVKIDGNAVAFSWNSVAGSTYQVLYLTDLTQTNWTVLSTNIATGPLTSFTNSCNLDQQRFYRVRKL